MRALYLATTSRAHRAASRLSYRLLCEARSSARTRAFLPRNEIGKVTRDPIRPREDIQLEMNHGHGSGEGCEMKMRTRNSLRATSTF